MTLALLLSQAESAAFNSLPHLVICASDSDCQKLKQGIQFFDPQRSVTVLPPFDVSPYSTLYPRRQSIAERCRFLWRAQNAEPGEIFAASAAALMQRTAPFASFRKHCGTLHPNSSLPRNLPEELHRRGYLSSPMVEDVGQYSIRGGIVDLYSPALNYPVRIELFGDLIESLRTFDPETQRSVAEIKELQLIPCREFFWHDQELEKVIGRFRDSIKNAKVEKSDLEETLRALARMNDFEGIDFFFPYFFDQTDSPLHHFSSSLHLWILDPIEVTRGSEKFLEEMRAEHQSATHSMVQVQPEEIWTSFDKLPWPHSSPSAAPQTKSVPPAPPQTKSSPSATPQTEESTRTEFTGIQTQELSADQQPATTIQYPTFSVRDLSQTLSNYRLGTDSWVDFLHRKLTDWRNSNYVVFFGVQNQSQAERLRLFLDRTQWRCQILGEESRDWKSWIAEQHSQPRLVHLIPTRCPEGIRFTDEKLIFLRDEDLFGRKTRLRSGSASEDFQKKAKRLNFGDLKPGDCVVHVLHGIGVYDGLKVMSIGGVENEFIQLSFRDKDKLYIPVYRVGQLQKYAGHAAQVTLDKLGSTQWEKTKAKVRNAMRDLAADLLQIYAQRAEHHRDPLNAVEEEYRRFEAAFPYDETDDQLRAIEDIVRDFRSDKPMDRLICGDVGFGKTEVAMRAAFIAAQNKKQVAIMAPTTVLTFQHFETLKNRFNGWPFEIRVINRFVSPTEARKSLLELKEGKVDILIGTHRLLSKDVVFSNLGLLIIDEEQKFGVSHKEKIRKIKAGVDTLAMSATPIPRTLNMSLMGVRDLSLINTAPVDRLPTRTFVSKWDGGMIGKALRSEVQRGGQVYFIHNRVQSIHSVADEIRTLVPELRIGIGHGQMEEHQLEKTMVAFFHHEIDILVCTSIVESGMDVPRANTMFIDQAHTLGLSQLYQLRGRVGRSKQRAYCYLLLPKNRELDKAAQERLKVIQENTALGSGIRIAQYDLELRGAGNLLGEEQSGHIDAVGYELYMDLLNEAIQQRRGESSPVSEVEPEINLRIPAMIPDSYIGDIRLRLSYYKALAEAQNSNELDAIEEELRDQFGAIPEPTLNLMGLMLIRSHCRSLGIRDISAGPKNVSLAFTDQTRLSPDTVVRLATRENKKYALTPDNRLNIRMNEMTWPRVYEELELLMKL
ncbi:MAG: transcription-repair coupling factor [Bdellovibrio sp.]|nr:MAG: transcription-repair coupling factor [Bdellovibrio sp.]